MLLLHPKAWDGSDSNEHTASCHHHLIPLWRFLPLSIHAEPAWVWAKSPSEAASADRFSVVLKPWQPRRISIGAPPINAAINATNQPHQASEDSQKESDRSPHVAMGPQSSSWDVENILYWSICVQRFTVQTQTSSSAPLKKINPFIYLHLLRLKSQEWETLTVVWASTDDRMLYF